MAKTQTPADLQKQFEAEKKKITDACANEVNEILKKYGCKITVSGAFQDGQIQTNVNITKI